MSDSSDDYGPELRFKRDKIRRTYEVLRAFRGYPLSLTQLAWRAYGPTRRLCPTDEREALLTRIRRLNDKLPEPWIITRLPEGYALINEDEL